MNKLKPLLAFVLLILAIFVLFDTVSSTVLIYTYRIGKKPNPIANERGFLSSEVFIRKTIDSLSRHDRITTVPSPLLIPDPELGFRASPGVYSINFSRLANTPSGFEFLKTKVTINKEGNRITGPSVHSHITRNLYLFGSSFTFGLGVNDEQTFPYLLQQKLGSMRVKLLAVPAYGLVQAYITFEKLKNEISSKDIVVLSYSEEYKKREVAAPSWLRLLGVQSSLTAEKLGHPKVSLDQQGQIQITQVPLYCKFNKDYCDRPDPSEDEMNRVTVALINHIANGSQAKFFLLHIPSSSSQISQGARDPVLNMIDKPISVISVLDSDFGSFVHDDVAGFNSHPGPYWHYAVADKLTKGLFRAGALDETAITQAGQAANE